MPQKCGTGEQPGYLENAQWRNLEQAGWGAAEGDNDHCSAWAALVSRGAREHSRQPLRCGDPGLWEARGRWYLGQLWPVGRCSPILLGAQDRVTLLGTPGV